MIVKAGVRYSKAFWTDVRELWEGDPNIKLVDALEEVAKKHELACPSRSTVHRKAKTGKWTKFAPSLVKKSATELQQIEEKERNKTKKVLRKSATGKTDQDGQVSDIENENGDFADDAEEAQQEVVNLGRLQGSGFFFPDELSGDFRIAIDPPSKMTATKIVKSTRRGFYQLQVTSEELLHAQNHLTKVLVDGDLSYAERKEVNKRYAIVKDSIFLLGKQAEIMAHAAKWNGVYWGLEHEQMVDQEDRNNERNVEIEKSEKVLEAQRSAQAQKYEAFQRKSELIAQEQARTDVAITNKDIDADDDEDSMPL